MTIPAAPQAQRAKREDVADRARPRLVPRLDHEDLTGGHALHGTLLRIELPCFRGDHVFPDGDVTDRLGDAHHPQIGAKRPETSQERRPDPSPLELRREGRGRDLPQRIERLGADGRRANADRAERLGSRLRIDPWHRTERLERIGVVHHLVANPPHAVDLDLDDVTGRERPGVCGCPGEDHVTGLEGHEPGEIGDEGGEGEQQLRRVPLLDEFTVDERAQREIVEVEIRRLHKSRADRREAVVPLGKDVRAAVRPAEVVHADVVGGRDPPDARRRIRNRDASRGPSDDERDLPLVAEELAALRAHDRRAVLRQRRGRLEKVGRKGRIAAPFTRATCVVEVDTDHLAGDQFERSLHDRDHIWCLILKQFWD